MNVEQILAKQTRVRVQNVKDYYSMYLKHRKNIYTAEYILKMITSNFGSIDLYLHPDIQTIKTNILNQHPVLKQEKLI